jgi:hypothetical protein
MIRGDKGKGSAHVDLLGSWNGSDETRGHVAGRDEDMCCAARPGQGSL